MMGEILDAKYCSDWRWLLGAKPTEEYRCKQEMSDNPLFQNFNIRSGDVLLPKIDFQEPLKVEINHFIDCIVNGTECITGIDHAKKVVEILSSCE